MVAIVLAVLGLVQLVAGLVISALPLARVGALSSGCARQARPNAKRHNPIRGADRAAPELAGHPAQGADLPAAVAGFPAAAGHPAAMTDGPAGAAPDATSADPHPLISMLVLAGINLACGLSAMAVGYFQLGFDAGHATWHWLPLVAGIPPTALAVIGLAMYGLGAAATATVGEPPTIAAVLVIRSVRDTGVYVNEKPRLEFDLEVRPEGMQPYRVTKRATVPFAALAHLRVGDGFRATVAGPGDPTNMDIDWAAPVPATGPVPDDEPAQRLRQLEELLRQGLVTEAEYRSQRARIIGSV
jgi:hypothetical protein